jgi:D-serine deaminase-like pyridoxal phosphate-dependent protein
METPATNSVMRKDLNGEARILDDLATPAVVIDRAKLRHIIGSMQAVCDAHKVEMRPHIKTHKMVEVAKLQLAAGARGLTCAKIGEAEAILPSGVRELFIAYSLVDSRQARRLAALAEQLSDLRLAATSPEQTEALARLARLAGRRFKVMMAVDTGLGREGSRDLAGTAAIAAKISASSHLELAGFYTHEGHLYSAPPAEQLSRTQAVIETLSNIRDSIDPSLPLWPGCSVNARLAAATGRIQAVRPGAYVFGDLYLSRITAVVKPREVALSVLATVVDKVDSGVALIDAGSKTFSSDRTAQNVFAAASDGRDLAVFRVNEEHGYVNGADAHSLAVGDRIHFTPAHVCPVLNLTDQVVVAENERVHEIWWVDARGRSQ